MRREGGEGRGRGEDGQDQTTKKDGGLTAQHRCTFAVGQRSRNIRQQQRELQAVSFEWERA